MTITDTDKSDLQTAINKESLSDLSAYHRRLHQFAAQGNLMTGFTQADMNWLHSRVETAMCAWHKKDDPPTKCADPSPLEWKKGFGGTEASMSEQETKVYEDKIAGLEATIAELKAGRVLSAANEGDLRDAVAAHNSGVKLTNGVLNQVTGTPGLGGPGSKPNQGDNPAPNPDAGDATPASGTNAASPDETKGEIATVPAVVTENTEPIVVETDKGESDDDIIVVDEDELRAVLQGEGGEVKDESDDEIVVVDEDELRAVLEGNGAEA